MQILKERWFEIRDDERLNDKQRLTIILGAIEEGRTTEREQLQNAFDIGVQEMDNFNNDTPEEGEEMYLMNGKEYYNDTYGSEG